MKSANVSSNEQHLTDAELDSVCGGGDSPGELWDELKGWVRLGVKKVKEALTFKPPWV
jgi:hypothetical protein